MNTSLSSTTRRQFLEKVGRVSVAALFVQQAISARGQNESDPTKTNRISKPMNEHSITSQPVTPIPSDDPKRKLKIARPNTDESLLHIGLVGDTYTVLISGDDTNGRYCLIDMHIPPGGGPPPHRHDFEESFTVLEGQIEATFRGEKSVVRTSETLSIPANAPHSFTNASDKPARLLCSVRRQGRRNSLLRLACPSRPAQRRRPSRARPSRPHQ